MTALHSEALIAAKVADQANAADPARVEKVLAAYLAVAFPKAASPEESQRFLNADGTPMVSVVVAKSLPFARALIYEWSLLDGIDRNHWLKWKAISLPASIYDAILDRARLRLRRPEATK